jgi:hypothetical protein
LVAKRGNFGNKTLDTTYCPNMANSKYISFFFLVARLRNLAQKENPLTGTLKKAQGRQAHEPAQPR